MLVANQMSFYVLLLFFIIVIVIFFFFFFFFMTNVYLLITSILINTMPHWTENLSRRRHYWFYPCFAVEKLVNCFLRHEYEKMTKTREIMHRQFGLLIYDTRYWKFTDLRRLSLSVFMCDTDVIISPSICGQVQLSSTEPLKLGFLNNERNNLVKFETS